MKKFIVILITGLLLMTGCMSEEKKQEKEVEQAKFDIECVLIEKSVFSTGRFGNETREGILEDRYGKRYLVEGLDAKILTLSVVGDKFIYNTKTNKAKAIK